MILEAVTATFMAGYFPPPRFDHPFPGYIETRWYDDEHIRAYCPIHGVACIIAVTEHRCIVAFNVRFLIEYDTILRHETGHCNGWPPDHPR